ncbi:Hypothetical protein R9X50_00285500 [Acrodontium crateriforme]|uniref:Enoyl reductase (ER) domain-containing protein n=1 Tax=Acrodontium crateriforme TaxID=150365 RepID=A0AAQ3M7V8_9PEZI|nr:Hypothetical protein R9X50_00285500 [Acrodontium crateriforme]
MVQTRQWILENKPKGGLPQLDGPEQTFKLIETQLPELKDDELLVKTHYLSNDPAQRGWISAFVQPERMYAPPVQVGTPMHAAGLGEVIESKSSKFKKGDFVVGRTQWAEHAIIPAAEARAAPQLPGGASRTQYLGALGMTGLTAYFGLTEVGMATAKDIVVISGAAGATGSMAVQIAKKIIGAKKVIGIAGTDDKCKWVESLGADLCLNYKSPNFRKELKAATPGPDGFADVYFDNVGGEILDFTLTRMAKHGRVIACGAIANYNASRDTLSGLTNWAEIISMRLNIRGFIVFDYAHKYGEAMAVFHKALQEGKLQIEGGEHVVKTNFEGVPKTWLSLFEGTNTGKLITDLS